MYSAIFLEATSCECEAKVNERSNREPAYIGPRPVSRGSDLGSYAALHAQNTLSSKIQQEKQTNLMTCDFWNRGAHHRQHPTCAQNRLVRLSPTERPPRRTNGAAQPAPLPALRSPASNTGRGTGEMSWA